MKHGDRIKGAEKEAEWINSSKMGWVDSKCGNIVLITAVVRTFSAWEGARIEIAFRLRS